MTEFQEATTWGFIVLFGIVGYFLRDIKTKSEKSMEVMGDKVDLNTAKNSEQEGILKMMERVHKEEIETIKEIQNANSRSNCRHSKSQNIFG